MARLKAIGTRKKRKKIPLNALALAIAFGGMLIPLVQQSPLHFAQGAYEMLAASGSTLSASVPANPYNTTAQQLEEKERMLAVREAELQQKEQSQSDTTFGEMFGFASFGLSIILLVLIGVNFYLDWRRNRKHPVVSSKFFVDLRP